MNFWLVGSGYWGSKIKSTLDNLGHNTKIIDIKNNQTIKDIDTPDPVILATPVWEHFEQAKELIKNGHHLYIEKPASENAGQINQLINLTKQDQVVMVGHIFVYNPLLEKLKKIIDDNVLGKIRFIHCERTNLGIYQTKTSTLLSLAPHDFSIIEYLFEDITVEHAKGIKLSNNIQYDRVCVQGKTKFGIQWQIDVSWRWPMRRRIVTVCGDSGQAVWNEDNQTIELYINKIQERRLIIEDQQTLTLDTVANPLQLELNHFVDCIDKKVKCKSDLHKALIIGQAIDVSTNMLD